MGSRKWWGLVASVVLVSACYGAISPIAEYHKGEIYWHGIHLPHHQQLAVHWLLKSAYQGYAPAEYALSKIYGPSRRSHYQGLLYLKQSYRWVKKAAAQGYVPAESYLSGFYDGSYTFQRGSRYLFPKNLPLAFYWEHKAAIQGYAYAETDVSLSYSVGSGVQKSIRKEMAISGSPHH